MLNRKPKAVQAKCSECPLVKCTLVPSYGPKIPKLIVVGESPGAHEAFHKMPFVGASGRLLRGLLEQIGYDPQQDVFYTNAALCYPITDGDAKRKQLSLAVPACQDRLKFALSQFGSEVPVLALGSPAMQALGIQPDMWTTEKLTGKLAIGTVHPAAVLYGDGAAMTFIIKVLEKLEAGPQAALSMPRLPTPIVIDNPADLGWDWTREPVGIITVDIETSSYEWHDPDAHIELVGLGWVKNWRSHSLILTRPVIYSAEGKAWLRSVLIKYQAHIGGHNFKFDMLFLDKLLNCGLNYGWDTAVMGFGLYPRWYKSLKEQARFYFDVEDWSEPLTNWLRDNIKIAAQRTYDRVPYDILIPYLNKDLHYNTLLAIEVERRLREAGKWEAPYLLHDLPVARLLTQMERTGVPIDPVQMKTEEQAFEQDKRNIRDLVELQSDGEITNPNSTQQCAKFLYGKLGLQHTAKGLAPHSTAAGALGTLDPDAHPVLSAIQRYRRVLKLQSAYISNMWDKLRPHPVFGTAVHPSYNQIKVVTSRLSAQNPPIQTIPKKKPRIDGAADYGTRIKNLYAALAGRKIVAVDGSQWELRVAAAWSQDPWLLDAYQNGVDVHGAACDMMYGEGQWDDADRTKEKNILFGLIYGGTLEGIVSSANITAGKASKVYYFFNDTLKVLMTWRDEMFEQAKTGAIISPYFNRSFEFPIVHKGNAYDVRKQAVNYPIQGTASNITMDAGVHAAPQLKQYGAWLIIPYHDELVAVVPDACVLQCAKILKAEMEAAGTRAFPIIPWKADAQVGSAWGQLAELEELNK